MGRAGRGSLIDLVALTRSTHEQTSDTLKRTLEAVRNHLGMQVAYVSEFADGRTVFREVDAPGLEAMVKVGDSLPLDEAYCMHILEGRLPEVISDVSAEPFAMAMPITAAAHIRSHISVPINLPNGRVYGMFCCVGFEANPTLNARDLRTMRAFADLAAFQIGKNLALLDALAEKRERIARAIGSREFSVVYQPVVDIASMRLVGFECLTRFTGRPQRPPNEWFGEAAEVGLGRQLELATLRVALGGLRFLPSRLHLAVNASAETIISGEFSELLKEIPLERIVLEITEHSTVEDYVALQEVLYPMREHGLKLAVDDAGAGYSSLRHILSLQPDFIKLDIHLIRHIDLDPARRALTAALISFARDTESSIIAEGIETAPELAALQSLGVKWAQGFLLGRPVPLDEAVRLASSPKLAVKVA